MRRVFYGWVIVAAAIGMVGVASGTLSSLAVFLRPMQDSMGWSRGEISGVAPNSRSTRTGGSVFRLENFQPR